jgi:hypothetical protein
MTEEATMDYPEDAIAQAKGGAMEWLEGNIDGYPRSWQQEEANQSKRDYPLYDEFEAPPIAGYEALEREGIVTRLETVVRQGQERIHFRLAAPPRS